MSWDALADAQARLAARTSSAWDGYQGFYSSWLGGYFRESWGMSVPLDDHGFHRGDGVFEAVRIHRRAFIDLTAHLERLVRSAASIGLEVPAGVEGIVLKLARLSDVDQGLLRLYVTRGPGGFSPNPAESVGPQIYAAITKLKTPSLEMYERGCRALISSVPAKDPFFARIKSLNYLQNVLVKKECVEKGFDLAVCFDADGRLCEGATENVMLVTADGRVRAPKFDYTLAGTTLKAVLRDAESVPGVGGVDLADLTLEDVHGARELAFVGTTLGVLPIGRLDDQPLAVGPVCTELQRRWVQRMGSDPGLRTAF